MNATWLLVLPLPSSSPSPRGGSEVRITFDQVAELELTRGESGMLIDGEERGSDAGSATSAVNRGARRRTETSRTLGSTFLRNRESSSEAFRRAELRVVNHFATDT